MRWYVQVKVELLLIGAGINGLSSTCKSKNTVLLEGSSISHFKFPQELSFSLNLVLVEACCVDGGTQRPNISSMYLL